jgi:chorismate-pyruvate lyase
VWGIPAKTSFISLLEESGGLLMSGNDSQSLLQTDTRQTKLLDINPADINVFQHILLITDGTVTDILEVFMGEKIQIIKIKEETSKAAHDIPALEILAGDEVIERHVFLQGKDSRKNYIYAKSLLIPAKLQEGLHQDILNSSIPLGQLWIEHKLETFKQIIGNGKEPANDLASHFGIARDDEMLHRTYRLFSNNHPCIMITEKFPACYFTDQFVARK